MCIMLDTNVILSALLFPSKRMNKLLLEISTNHTLVLSSFVIDELLGVVSRKFPKKINAVDGLLAKMSFEMVYTPKQMDDTLFDIRDSKDYPVLYSAIVEDVDILITGDKDFADIVIEKPKILTPSVFVEQYC